MTLKQFVKAAAGVIIALLINASGIIFFIKWPLMLFFGGGGLLLAFVPYEDRPLETWVMAFVRSIYSPTIFVYRKKKTIKITPVEVKKEEEKKEVVEEESTKVKKDEKKVREFISSLPSVKREEKKEEKEEVVLIKKDVIIKDVNPEIQVDKKATEANASSNKEEWRDQKSDLNLQRRRLEATGETSFGTIPMPDIPEVANVLVGMATDVDGKIIDGAIVEIQDDVGNPSRVLKTNSLGQFRTSTPMANGKYLIITEKEGYDFHRISVELKGEIVQPIKIISK